MNQNPYLSLEKTAAISGILSVILYVSAVAIPALPDSVSRIFGFTFPLLWIIAFMGLYHFLRRESTNATLEIAYIFGIIGGALACSLIIVQQANIIWHQEAMAVAETSEAEALLKATFRGANRVQSGLDVAFDVFITIAWILFGLNIAKNKHFNKLIGWSGSLIAFGLLFLNLYTFPDAPAESGFFDFGPFLGLWALVFFIWFTTILYRKPN